MRQTEELSEEGVFPRQNSGHEQKGNIGLEKEKPKIGSDLKLPLRKIFCLPAFSRSQQRSA